MKNRNSRKHVAIIGGGIIGLGIGWQLAKAGYNVSIHERGEAGREASWAAAGMLSPLAEINFDERNLLQIGLTSYQIYPEWVRELESDSGMSVEFRTEGTLIIALHQISFVQNASMLLKSIREGFDHQAIINL